MAYQEYVPNEKIVDRAVEIWIRALRNPTYDVGLSKDPSPSAGMGLALMHMVASNLNKNNQEEEVLAKFGQELKKLLMNKQVSVHNPNYVRYIKILDVDYHECETLSQAAKAADLKMMFPTKTTMHIYDDCVEMKMGYAAPYDRHYPLPDGRWLITSLTGKDIQHVIHHFATGEPLKLEIEPAQQ